MPDPVPSPGQAPRPGGEAPAPPGADPPAPARPTADLRRLRRMLRYIKPYRFRMIVGLVSGALYGAISGAFPKAVESVCRNLFEADPRPSAWTVVATGLAIPSYFALRGAIGFVSTYSMSWVSARMLRDVRNELFAHLQNLSMDFFVKGSVSQMIQRVSDNTARMQQAIVSLAGDTVKQPVTIVVAVGFLAFINAWFCLFALALGAVCLVPMVYFGRKVRKSSAEEVKSAGELLGVLHESLNNIRVIKAYLLEGVQEGKFRKTAQDQMSRSLRFRRQRETLSPLIETIGSFGMAGALVYVFMSNIDFSEFLAVVAGFFMLYEPLKKMGTLHVEVQGMLAVSDRVFEVLDTRPALSDKPDALELNEFHKEIRYDNVGLEYSEDREALSDIELTIPRGSVCALVGPSGSGKTSLVNLLMRFYDPTRGAVRIDGHDLRDVSTASLRRLIGLVTQETLLFADTVANNIGYGRAGATREEVVEAARQAEAHEFIMAMPQQYDTLLTDRGQNLSGGQRQRIAVARAFLKNPAILVLDEATSALDAESERKVQEAMAHLMRGRTVVIIAHRFSTVRHADQIVVLDEGRIPEQGAHEELITRNGLYRRLHDLQVVPW